MPCGLVAVGKFVVRTENVDDFVLVKLNHIFASLAAILTRIEIFGMKSECLANACRERKTRVGVDVDFANGALRCLAELILGYSDSIGKVASVFVDDVNIFLRHGRRAVEHDGESGELLFDFGKYIECQWRRNKTAGLRVACALFGLELVCTV